MIKRYILPLFMLVLISATKVASERYSWNFKDYNQIEYEVVIEAVNRTDYSNQKNGVKVTADYVLKIIDSTHANLLVSNKKVIESTNDSITTYDEIELEDQILYKDYTKNGVVLGKISDDAIALKDILFPILEKDINVGDSIAKSTHIPFNLGQEILDLKGDNVISKVDSENGIETFTSTLNSPRYPVKRDDIPNLMVYFDGKTDFKFDNKRGVFLNEEIKLNIKVIGEIDGKLSDIFSFEVSQQIELKNLK